MSTVIAVFNFIAWLVGAPIVIAAVIAVTYEFCSMLLEGLRVKLRNNQRFMEWLDKKAREEQEDDLIEAYTLTEVFRNDVS